MTVLAPLISTCGLRGSPFFRRRRKALKSMRRSGPLVGRIWMDPRQMCLHLLHVSELQNNWGGKGGFGSLQFNFLIKDGPSSNLVDCPWPCPVEFWISPRMENAQPLWSPFPMFDHTCSEKYFLASRWDCLSPPILSCASEKSPALPSPLVVVDTT